MDQGGIWILEEHDMEGTKDITLELLSEGRKLARRLKEPLCVCLLGPQPENNVHRLSRYGVEKAYIVESEMLSNYNMDAYLAALGSLIEEYHPSVFFMGATPIGAEMAPRVAAKFRLPCVTEAKKIKGKKRNFKITKACYDDRVYMNIVPQPGKTLVLTLTPGDTDIDDPGEPEEVETIKKDFKPLPHRMRTTYRRFIKGDPSKIGIEESDVILAVGDGVNGETFPMAQELADYLDASIGGTRVAVDKNVIPFERQIGATGKTVNPKFLMACGISGAPEFTSGMDKSKLTIAVNTDSRARIFDFADFKVLGDLRGVIPALINKLKQTKGTE